jgi:hypothetical protein
MFAPCLQSAPGSLEVVTPQKPLDLFACDLGATLPVGLNGLLDATGKTQSLGPVVVGSPPQGRSLIHQTPGSVRDPRRPGTIFSQWASHGASTTVVCPNDRLQIVVRPEEPTKKACKTVNLTEFAQE